MPNDTKVTIINADGTAVSDANPFPTSATIGNVSVNTTAVATAAAPTYAEGDPEPLSQDLSGNLRITGSISAETAAVATAAAPSYVEGSTDALSQTLAGSLRTLVTGGNLTSGGNVTVTSGNITVAGAVTANAGTNLNTSALALEAGNLQTIAGIVTSSRAAVNPISGQAGVAAGNGTVSATTQRVTLATDVPLPAGTNVIGHTIVDSGAITVSGSLTAAGNVTNAGTFAVQVTAAIPAGTNVIGHVIVDSGSVAVTNAGTFAVQVSAALPAGTNAIGNITNVGSVSGNVSVLGPTASGSSLTVAPITQGGRAATANPTAVTNGQVVNTAHDSLGKMIAVSAIRELKAVTQTTVSNSTGETLVVSAGGAGVKLDVYGVICANSGASATLVSFKDATAGTTRFKIEVPAGDTRGFMLDPGGAVPQATANGNWTATCSVATTAMEITMLTVSNV